MPSVTRHPTGQDLMCLVCLKPAQDIDHVRERSLAPHLARGAGRVSKLPGAVQFYVAGPTQSYEVIEGVCCVCDKPLPYGDDVVDVEPSGALTEPTSPLIAGEGLAPGDKPGLPVKPSALRGASATGVEPSIGVVTGGATVEVPAGAESSAVGPDGSAAETAGNFPASAVPEVATPDGAELPLRDVGGAHPGGAVGVPAVSTGGEGDGLEQGQPVASSRAEPLPFAFPVITTACCAECLFAGLARYVYHYDPSIISDSRRNLVPLCRECHQLKTTKKITTRIRYSEGSDVYEWRRNIKGAPWIVVPVEVSKRYKCLVRTEVMPNARQPKQFDQREVGRDGQVLSAAAESGHGSDETQRTGLTMKKPLGRSLGPTEGSAAAPSAGMPTISKSEAKRLAIQRAGSKEESNGEHDLPKAEGEAATVSGAKAPQVEPRNGGDKHDLWGGDDGGGSFVQEVPPDSDSVRGAGLTHEQRVAIAQEIKDAQLQRQWRAGDVANAWEEELNEDFWNRYANEFGYTYPSLRNVMRVCSKIPSERRHPEVSFAHHNVMVGHDIETRDAWLERAHDEEWPVNRLREELVEAGLLTKRPKIKRWTLDDLWKLFEEWHEKEECEDCHAVDDFFRWLGEQG